MELFILTLFILGYVSITLEHFWKIDKLIPALLMMVTSWAVITVGIDSIQIWSREVANGNTLLTDISHMTIHAKLNLVENTLLHHLGKTAEIIIFLMGAMAIVELIDYFSGFVVIRQLIKTKSKRSLLWILSLLTFFLSSIIDNLTATIVLITILRKLVTNQNDRMWFTGFIIIAANAGGAWSPIGDVTTTMLWMGNKVTSINLIKWLFIPSLLNILVPLSIGTFLPAFNGQLISEKGELPKTSQSVFALVTGLFLIVCVPIFKTLTNLPPYMGMLFSFAVFAVIAEIMTKKDISFTQNTSVSRPTIHALSKIEIPSILFFLGILMMVASMESLGMIVQFGNYVNHIISTSVFVTLLGIGSAIIDNVPLVAASIGMFQDACDSSVWHWIAYAAGTGGSILIIGSAAGIVAMGMEKITFGWYLKRISLLAFAGYLSGIIFLFLTTK
jgi:Na+/H+ antiporter NhaD/arsenite permease-like protein